MSTLPKPRVWKNQTPAEWRLPSCWAVTYWSSMHSCCIISPCKTWAEAIDRALEIRAEQFVGCGGVIKR